MSRDATVLSRLLCLTYSFWLTLSLTLSSAFSLWLTLSFTLSCTLSLTLSDLLSHWLSHLHSLSELFSLLLYWVYTILPVRSYSSTGDLVKPGMDCRDRRPLNHCLLATRLRHCISPLNKNLHVLFFISASWLFYPTRLSTLSLYNHL